LPQGKEHKARRSVSFDSYRKDLGSIIYAATPSYLVDLQISIRESGDVTILDLLGRSTIGVDSELLSCHLQKLVDSDVRKLLLNLAEVTQVDSTGVSVIVSTYVSLRRQGGDLKLLCPRGRVREVMRVTRLLDVIPTFEDETQALASFAPRSYSAKR
jgi:anti-anti-sigma factor